MSDGAVILILELSGIANYLNLFNSKSTPPMKDNVKSLRENPEDDLKEVLLVQASQESQYGLPIKGLKRIEKIMKNRIERTGKQFKLQYNDQIIPLWSLCSLLSGDIETHLDETSPYAYVIVFANDNELFGYMVDHVEDIKSINYNKLQITSRGKVLGTTVLQGKITEIVDMNEIFGECSQKIKQRNAS